MQVRLELRLLDRDTKSLDLWKAEGVFISSERKDLQFRKHSRSRTEHQPNRMLT